MRPVCSLLTVVWVAMAISPQRVNARAITTESGRERRPPNLSLTVSLERVRYCKGDANGYTVHFGMTVRFTNRDPGRVIMYRPTKPIDITSGQVSKSTKALLHGEYETTLDYDTFVEPPTISDSAKPDRRFAIVGPGKSYALKANVAVLVRFRPSPPIPGTIAHGTHVMTINVIDWPFTVDSGERLYARWANLGVLNYRSNTSEPFEFSIPAIPVLQDCSGSRE